MKLSPRYLLLLCSLVVLSACRPQAKVVQTGPPGPQGPPGVGCSEVVIQPAPGEGRGRDAMLSAMRDKQGKLPVLSLGAEKNSNVNRIVLYFDVTQAELPPTATILAAILVLHPNNTFCSPGRISAHVYPLLKSWVEDDTTWLYADAKTHWELDGGDFLVSLPMGSFWAEGLNLQTAPRIEIHLDPTLVQGWLNGVTNYGLLIRADMEIGMENMVTFYSREYSLNPSKRPALKIIYKQ